MHHYVIALGSNQPHGRHGPPRRVLLAALDRLGLKVTAQSPIVGSAPLGPSQRYYANAVAQVETAMVPEELLCHLKGIEAEFGRRPCKRWGSRVLDLDIILWSGGFWASPQLTIPHPAFRVRDFVLAPLTSIVPRWSDPATGLTVRQLKARLDRRRPRN